MGLGDWNAWQNKEGLPSQIIPNHTHNPPKSQRQQDALELPFPRHDYLSTNPRILAAS
jgi:hypothetical protein